MTGELILGWDVGGTKSAAVIGTAAGEVLDRRQWDSDAHLGSAKMLADFLVHARDLLARHAGECHGGVGRVGVSIGGPLNTLTGVVLSPLHLPGWDNVPLVEILRRELGLPAVVEHDAAACLEAEWLWGAARGTTHCAYFTCGTGFGAGVMIDGRILRGPSGQSPEIGHVRINRDGPVMFGKAGCSESFCSGEGIAKLAGFMFPERFGQGGASGVSTRQLMELTQQGDDQARAVLEESARRTGQVCAMLADLIAPQVIVLGSLARYFGQWWLAIVREEFGREVLPLNGGRTQIVASALGERLQDLSAIAPCVFRVELS